MSSRSEHGEGRVEPVPAARRALRQCGVRPMVARATDRGLAMDVETVKFEGSRIRFEFTGRRPGLTTMRAVYRGKEVVHTMALPGDPAPLAALLRERARCPADVMTLVSKMAA
jgi:hypothetical protein